MYENLIKKHYTKYLLFILLFFFENNELSSSPWVTPDDILVRHDLQILADAGILNIPINTWPIAWGDVAYNIKYENLSELPLETLQTLKRVRERIEKEEILGLSAEAEIKLSMNPDQFITFFDPVNNEKSASTSASFMTKNVALNLKLEKNGSNQLLDESYISFAKGNYTLTLGSRKNWWGPGWMGSTALSTNSRPIKGLTIDRTFSDPFENKILGAFGSWDLSFIFGNLTNNLIPDRRFTALRVGLRPRENVEVGITESAIICNSTNNCLLEEIVEGLKGSDENYNLTTFDYRVSGSLYQNNYAIYGQISGSSLEDSFGLLGIETWGSNDSKEFQSFRFFTELTSTSCGVFKGERNFGCAYQNQKYPFLYQNDGKNIGYSLDGDSMLISLGGIFVIDDTQLYKSTISMGKINKDSNSNYSFKKNNTDFLNINFGYQFDLYWYDIPLGSYDIGIGIDIYKDRVTGNSENDPRAYLAWKNSIDLLKQRSKGFSDFIEFDEILYESLMPGSKKSSGYKFKSFNESKLTSIISLVDQTTINRDGNIFVHHSPKYRSTNEIIDEISQSSNNVSLSNYLARVDETISNRN